MARGLADEVVPEADRYGVSSGSRRESREEPHDVSLDGRLPDGQQFADLAVVVAVGDRLEDLDLPRREPWSPDDPFDRSRRERGRLSGDLSPGDLLSLPGGTSQVDGGEDVCAR